MKNFEKMLYPKQLKKGDTVGIICPSSAIPSDKIEKVKSCVENIWPVMVTREQNG